MTDSICISHGIYFGYGEIMKLKDIIDVYEW